MAISLQNIENRVTALENSNSKSLRGFPNFNAGKTISIDTLYTADTNGFVSISTHHNEGTELSIIVDDVTRYYEYASYGTFMNINLYPIPQGSKYKVSGSPIQSLTWFPENKYYLFSDLNRICQTLFKEVVSWLSL